MPLIEAGADLLQQGRRMVARPLVRALRSRFPRHRLFLSTTTVTASAPDRSWLPFPVLDPPSATFDLLFAWPADPGS